MSVGFNATPPYGMVFTALPMSIVCRKTAGILRPAQIDCQGQLWPIRQISARFSPGFAFDLSIE
jgi:hypothetical protein